MTKEQHKQLEAELWSAADNLRADSDFKSSEHSVPVLTLIFLKFADNKYKKYEGEIRSEYDRLKGTRREKSIEKKNKASGSCARHSIRSLRHCTTG